MHNLIESKMGAIEVLRSELNQVFDRLDTLEDKVEEMQAAVKDDSGKEKVAILESKVRELQEAVTKNPLKTKVAELELKLTNINSAMRKPMRDGRDFSNPKTLIRKSCAVCSETFLKNADLEKHMTEHDAPRDFECTVCAKKFFLEWRMKKHSQMHTVIPRTCRYFSTKMPCPFEEIGCKFSHTTLLQPATCHVDVYGHADQPQHPASPRSATRTGRAAPASPRCATRTGRAAPASPRCATKTRRAAPASPRSNTQSRPPHVR